jgi:diguanylate cyclase (GGDEF)-like protein/PAS domain S-box-containing protein/putative nucleotidyltransferase with HDIG domain
MVSKVITILAIDDNPDNLTILKALIKETFPEAVVLTAQTGKKGLEIAAREVPEIILLDVIMPGMDGYEVCSRLKADSRLSDIPVVFVTAIKSDKESRIKALACGADAFLAKPIDESELTAQIKAMLKISEANARKKNEQQVLKRLVDEKTKELILSEEKFQLLFEKAPLGYQSLDINGCFIDVNQKWLDLFGYSKEDVIGQWFGKFLCPEYVEAYRQRFPIFLSQGHIHSEFEMLSKKGDRMYIAFEGSIGYGADGSFKQTHCILKDITDQKKAEKALVHSHDLMRYIIEHNRGAVAVHDKDLNYMYVSKRYLDNYRIKDPDIIGKHHYEVMPNIPQKWRDVHQQALQGIVSSSEKDAYFREDGSLEWTRWECRPWYESDGSIGGIIIYTEIITEHVKLLEELQDKEYNLRLAQEIAHVGSFEFDPVRNKFTCSDEALNILGQNREDYTGTLEDLLLYLHPNDRETALQSFIETKEPNSFIDIELCLIRKDNQERIVDFRARSVFDETGQYLKIAGTMQDITERKKAEQNLIYLNTHDFLTGLYNRRYFEEELKKIDIAENLPISIIMADTNGLKLINDSFGHDSGDELLKKSALAIRQACRPQDLLVRYGGDEFVIVLPKTNHEKTMKIASAMKELTLHEEVNNIEISLSYGCATKHAMYESIMEILANAENKMYSHKLSERSSMRSKTTEIIMNTLFEKSNRESQHSVRVSRICEAIANAMKSEKQEISKLRIAGLVHDIGKIGIDEKILNKNGRLDKEERIQIEKHAEAGWRILNSSNEFSELANCVLHHHERWDGYGYPEGLNGEMIPLESRIITVADSYDAMTSERSYKSAMSHEEAIIELMRCSGNQFDPTIVEVFLKIPRTEISKLKDD